MAKIIMLFFILAAAAIVVSIVVQAIRKDRRAEASAEGAGCGKCGYPARGLTSFECPECGADLRVVGIRLPGQGGGAVGLSVLFICLFSVVYLVVAGVLYEAIYDSLPSYMQVDAHIDLTPASGQYDAMLLVEGRDITNNRSGYSSSFGFSRSSSHSAPNLSLRLDGVTPTMRFDVIELRVVPTTPPGSAWNQPVMEVDPQSGQATWTDLNGKQHQSKAAVTEQEVLAFLGSAGSDVTRQDTIDESAALHGVIDGLAQGNNRFTLQGFQNNGSGSGMGGSRGPPWFDTVYNLSAIALWIVGIVWIVRRARRRVRS